MLKLYCEIRLSNKDLHINYWRDAYRRRWSRIVVAHFIVVTVNSCVASAMLAKFRSRCRQRHFLSFTLSSRKIRLWWSNSLHYLVNLNAFTENMNFMESSNIIVIICPIAITYSMGQIINPSSLLPSVFQSACTPTLANIKNNPITALNVSESPKLPRPTGNLGRGTRWRRQILDRKWKYSFFAHAQWKMRNITLVIYYRNSSVVADLLWDRYHVPPNFGIIPSEIMTFKVKQSVC